MIDSVTLIDVFIRGLAVGAMLVTPLAVLRSPVTRDIKIATVLLGISTSAWLVTESRILCAAFGDSLLLWLPAMPIGALFWLFVLCVFEDRRLSWLLFSPALLLLVTGVPMQLGPPEVAGPLWLMRNVLSGLLAAHAGVVVLRGWRGDLIEGRRRSRVIVVTLIALYAIMEAAISILHRIDPEGPWLTVAVGEPAGGAMIAGLILAVAGLFLQARPALFGASRRAEPAPDTRAEAIDRLAIERLQTTMAAEGWRREGLTIGDLAAELDLPEHRLRRLINQRLGHRNFADFVNGQRIEAAKRRLADPAEARTTVAAIAFDLGFGSLGPFNRAFRAATGSTPTEWRRQALALSSPKLQDAV